MRSCRLRAEQPVEFDMNQTNSLCRLGGKAVLMALLIWPALGSAQLLPGVTETVTAPVTAPTASPAPTLAGQAAAVRASTPIGATTLADTGTLGGADDARNASALTGSIPSLLAGEVLAATTIGWSDQVSSDASLANLGMSVAGIGISADFVSAAATAVAGAAGSGSSLVENLAINGAPVSVTGDPNQVVDIAGGRIVINEQQASAGGMVVNALHVIVDGVADVVVGSASAAIR
jgi:hypothetical protein